MRINMATQTKPKKVRVRADNGEPLFAPLNVKNNFPTNDPLSGVFDQLGSAGQQPLSQPWTTLESNSIYLFTMDRTGLTYTYKTHGIMKKPIDVPVNDAFRGGIIIKSEQLDGDDIKLLQQEIRKQGDIHQLKQALKWRRLFGGSGLIICVPGNFTDDFDPEDIVKGEPLQFIAADRWELLMSIINPLFQMIQPIQTGQFPNQANMSGEFQEDNRIPYNYYGLPINKARVLRIVGEDAPSLIRPQLQGWGLSAYESILRDLNAYIKNNQVIFKFLDEAKVDVLRLMGFNDSILAGLAKGQIHQRIQLAMYGKNYLNSLLLDSEDEFDTKEHTFAGLAEIIMQIRIGMAAAIGMPMTKLFGMSASGFNSGEDDIEVYNALVESEVREPAMDMLTHMIPMRCRQLFGFSPEDLTINFHPLRVIGAVEEEAVKTSKQNRTMQLFDRGLSDGQETMESLKEDELFIHETNVLDGAEPQPPNVPGQEEEGSGKDKPIKAKNDFKRRPLYLIREIKSSGGQNNFWAAFLEDNTPTGYEEQSKDILIKKLKAKNPNAWIREP